MAKLNFIKISKIWNVYNPLPMNSSNYFHPGNITQFDKYISLRMINATLFVITKS